MVFLFVGAICRLWKAEQLQQAQNCGNQGVSRWLFAQKHVVKTMLLSRAVKTKKQRKYHTMIGSVSGVPETSVFAMLLQLNIQ